jgi:hypothetical protein
VRAATGTAPGTLAEFARDFADHFAGSTPAAQAPGLSGP